MSNWELETPVAFFIFNRPEPTERVFAAIAAAKPCKLLIVADGARPQREGEAKQCAATRAIIDRVDWDCEILTNYADQNMGCGRRVSSGLDWVFEQVERAIILEDDCLPDPSFFRYCEELLHRYEADERVMMISGTNQLGDWKADRQSYHFSYYGCVWGWATWRRAWQHYDFEMARWHDEEVRERVADIIADPQEFRRRIELFNLIQSGRIDTWDYQWTFAKFAQSGLTVVPALNMVSNIGFGSDATHTTSVGSELANLSVRPLDFPLRVPYAVAPDREYDRKLFQRVNPPVSLLQRVRRKLKRVLS